MFNEDAYFYMPLTRLLIEPAKLELTDAMYEGKCVIGIFISNSNYEETVVIGNQFFLDHYIMYDMTPMEIN
jgi:hypothetical protein